jgi:hypothetical protein
MTNRYEMLIQAIQNSNLFITQMFLFALFALLAWKILDWTPPILRRPFKYLYAASMLALFLVTVFL